MRTIKDIFWWILHRMNPKHRYHKPLCTLNPGYHDPDERITNTIFTEICGYVNKMEAQGLGNWTCTEEHTDAWSILKEAEIYWTDTRVKKLDLIEFMWESDNTDLHNIAYDEEEKIKEMDKEHLIDVIRVIHFIWYP